MISIFSRLSIILVLFFLSMQLRAQQKCGTVFPTEALNPRAIPDRDSRSDPYIIPVLFHVYWNEGIVPIAPTYIVDVLTQTNARLRAENPDVAMVPDVFQAIVGDAEIELQLAKKLPGNVWTSGIIYHNYNFPQGPVPLYSNSVETSHYLNIHVLPSTNSYALFPGSSKIINEPIDCIVFSTYDILNRIEILTHEVGHWFGLYHTFGPTNTPGGDCGDDLVDDTPPTRGSLDCNLELIDCTSGVVENVNNFMDYTNCGSMFTSGQAQRMHGILEDPTLNRIQIYQPENLLYTGVGETDVCARTSEVWYKSFEDCGTTAVRYSYLVQGQIPDSVLWEFYTIGPIPEYSTVSMPWFDYSQSGLAIVYLWLYFGSEAELIIINHQVVVNEIPTSMPEISEFPFGLDPDDGLVLPNEHMNLLGVPVEEGWQICDFAGYNSNECIYVPARVVDGEEVADLEIGMFNMSGLTQPTISFHVAAAMVPQGAFHILEILFRDECSTVFIGDVWVSRPLYEIFNNNTSGGFIPDSDNQWVEVSATFPEWIYASHAFITIRLRTIMEEGFSGEPFYLDNFKIGDLESATSVQTLKNPESTLLFYPNPVKGQLNWSSGGETGLNIRIFDAIGRLFFDQPLDSSTGSIDIYNWAPGIYNFILETRTGYKGGKFVVE